MNGNRHIIIYLLILFIAGCSASQQVTSQEVDTVKVVQEQEEAPEDTIAVAGEDSSRFKEFYDIALVLPFYLDSVYEIPDSVEVSYYQESEIAVEFYNGVVLALDSLKKLGFKANIHVFDDLNDGLRMKDIAHDLIMKSVDLLIGPVFNNNLRIMSQYAKRDSIYLVSPLSPADNITRENPFYIMVNPSVEVHCRKLFDYVVARHQKDNIIILSRPGAEQEYADIFKNLLKQYRQASGNYSVQFIDVAYVPDDSENSIGSSKLNLFLDSAKNNVILVPSVDKAYTPNLGRELFSLAKPSWELKDAISYKITVMG